MPLAFPSPTYPRSSLPSNLYPFPPQHTPDPLSPPNFITLALQNVLPNLLQTLQPSNLYLPCTPHALQRLPPCPSQLTPNLLQISPALQPLPLLPSKTYSQLTPQLASDPPCPPTFNCPAQHPSPTWGPPALPPSLLWRPTCQSILPSRAMSQQHLGGLNRGSCPQRLLDRWSLDEKLHLSSAHRKGGPGACAD